MDVRVSIRDVEHGRRWHLSGDQAVVGCEYRITIDDHPAEMAHGWTEVDDPVALAAILRGHIRAAGCTPEGQRET